MNQRLKRRLRFVAVAIFLPLIAGALEGKIRKKPHAIKDEYIVILRDDVPRADVAGIANRLTRGKGLPEKIWEDAVKGFFVRMNEGQAFGLSHDPDVAWIEENAEMFMSPEHATDIDPATCVQPTDPSCQATTDDRLWHLDQVDQNTSDLTKKFRYCNDATGVTVYVLDTGVLAAHTEFVSGQVVTGFNASGDGDYYPAWNPCAGSTLPAVAGRGHGTAVASLVAGRRVGVAKSATIVPVKVSRCGDNTAEPLQQFTSYPLGKMVGGGAGKGAKYRTTKAGTTGPESTYPPSEQWGNLQNPVCWGTPPNEACFLHVGVVKPQTTQMMIDGINWIVGSSNPNPSQRCVGNPPPANCGPAVATFSTFSVPATDTPVQIDGLEQAVRTMISRGITVVASANNQNGNACDTSPGRMSAEGTLITAGGTMIVNDPDPRGDGDGGMGQLEPLYDSSKGTRAGRWRCGPGDTDLCTQNGTANPPPTPLPPTAPNYPKATAGSNGGACVTLFAPAKNITVADFASTNAYRNRRAAGANTSGTSWSAPLTAGVAARILKANPTLSGLEVRNAIVLDNAVHGALDTTQLDPPGITAGATPNIVLRLANVSMATQPTPTINGSSTTIAAAAQTTSSNPLIYQWYQVNGEFDLDSFPRGAHASLPIDGATNPSALKATLTIPTPGSKIGYWVRVNADCGTVDSDIVIVDPTTPVSPMNVVATAGGGSVTVTWSASPNADAYHLERKVTGQSWTLVASTPVSDSPATTLPDTAPPITDDGVAVYRVRASRGSLYSSYSALDFAHPKEFADTVAVKALDIIELRKAVNAMSDAAGLALPYAAADLLESSLKATGRRIEPTDFTDLMSRTNSVRTNVAFGKTAASFVITPSSNTRIFVSQISNLRSAVE